ncbi:hypothetical protein [Mycobacterium sp. 236(2023)]|nr:hypothetical protein [Mycobacterium sp. 236(2023)]MDG4663128.1 hypothetical protein [Mycobacterium sp. 236(2023)]
MCTTNPRFLGRLSNPRRTGAAPWKPMLGMTGPTVLELEFDA